ncbi:ABC transporter permease [Microbacterium testaceum]|jgi:peptide/nickel transport system permease protein|uniref:ABC transporter permease n=1 Tax=Microbacterium testaceum TaxID=2033 RepID=UPI000734D1AD|nr:ABC transporter permease [Microbacterium testaceum]KTS05725.1 peptide ABC transporter permease [Microbacterium testaceum]KTS64561.1 peptide ABC transporter permease [Microbacterium testaceum]KTS91258.1 peptide ABC transporter permease [Microbacterium testaceum]
MTATLTAPGRVTNARARGIRLSVPVSVVVSFAVVAVVLAFSIAPALFTSQNPAQGVPADKLQAPSAAHLLGTDHLGRDLFARIVFGAQSSVTSALVAVAIGVVVGGLIGLLAGFLGSWTDVVLARFVDVLLAIPAFLLAVVIVSSLGFQTINAAIATGVSAVAVFARVMRSEVIRVRSSVFVEAARLQGGSTVHVLLRHVLPNASRSLIPLAVLQFGLSILVIAGLAFLGYGDPPPASDWGLLISAGKDYPRAPWLVVWPALVTVATVLSINRISRWLRRTS